MTKKRTYSDRREYMIRAVAKRRREVKRMAVQLMGGKCEICGYSKYVGALDLHHVYGEKDFGMGDKGYTRSWKKIKDEIKKCVLLCANCHREVEGGVVGVPMAREAWKNLGDLG